MLKDIVLGHIALADRHLKEAEARITQMRSLIENVTGGEKARAEAVLATFLEIRDQMRVHRRQLDEQLRLAVPPESAGDPKNGPA